MVSVIAIIALVGSFLMSFTGTFVVRRVARHRGFVDEPGGHKQHAEPVALGGGIAIAWTVFVPVLAATCLAAAGVRWGVPDWVPEFVRFHLPGVESKGPAVLAVLSGGILLHVVGLADDVKAMGPWVKLLAEVCVALYLSLGFNISILELEALPRFVSVILTILWIVGITNAFNFLDNMDGLSAGVAAIAGSIFAAAAFSSGQIFVPIVTLILVGAVLGFLVFNFQPATVFMGDSGSLVIGYLLAVLIVLTTFYDPDRQLKPAGVFLPVVVLAVPLYDVASVCVRRIKAGVSVFRGDRRHFSHRLVERGFSERAAVLTIYLATAATSLAAILLPQANWVSAGLIFAQCVCVVLIIAVLEHGGRANQASS